MSFSIDESDLDILLLSTLLYRLARKQSDLTETDAYKYELIRAEALETFTRYAYTCFFLANT